jgi:hypothetical protein
MTYLITAAEAVTLAFNDKNFLSGKILDSHLEVAHEALLRPALGDTFYELLVAATPTGVNKTFVDSYLKKPLAFYVRYIILPEIMVHVSNTGMGMIQPQGTIAVTDKQAGLVREQARENAEILMQKALAYLDDHLADYPTFEVADTVRENTKVIGGVIF